MIKNLLVTAALAVVLGGCASEGPASMTPSAPVAARGNVTHCYVNAAGKPVCDPPSEARTTPAYPSRGGVSVVFATGPGWYPCTPEQEAMDRFLFGSATPPCGYLYQYYGPTVVQFRFGNGGTQYYHLRRPSDDASNHHH